MVDCGICANPNSKDVELRRLNSTRIGKPGDEWEVSFNVVSLSRFVGDTIHVSVVDESDNTCLFEAEVDLPAKQTKAIRVTGVMPERDLPIVVSLVDDNYLSPDNCEVVKRFTIKKGDTTVGVLPEWRVWIMDYLVEITAILIILIIGVYYVKGIKK